ncbi:MAG: hypothetical protein ACYC6G_14420 [Desulfobaccales bacterium]
MATRNSKIILGLALVLLIAGVGPAFSQATKDFTGKITEIAKGTELNVNKRDIFYIVRLDEYPNNQFRLSLEDAMRFGVIGETGATTVLSPKMSKGLGWKVKLTCDANKTGSLKSPIYKVISLVRLDT